MPSYLTASGPTVVLAAFSPCEKPTLAHSPLCISIQFSFPLFLSFRSPSHSSSPLQSFSFFCCSPQQLSPHLTLRWPLRWLSEITCTVAVWEARCEIACGCVWDTVTRVAFSPRAGEPYSVCIAVAACLKFSTWLVDCHIDAVLIILGINE